jgi:hypothetical protein
MENFTFGEGRVGSYSQNIALQNTPERLRIQLRIFRSLPFLSVSTRADPLHWRQERAEAVSRLCREY